MSSAADPLRHPHWYFVPVRVVVITAIITLLCFALSLLLGIIGIVVAALVRGVHPNMTLAYRRVAFPVAVAAAAIGLVCALVMEIRQYRHERTLNRMEEQLHGGD